MGQAASQATVRGTTALALLVLSSILSAGCSGAPWDGLALTTVSVAGQIDEFSAAADGKTVFLLDPGMAQFLSYPGLESLQTLEIENFSRGGHPRVDGDRAGYVTYGDQGKATIHFLRREGDRWAADGTSVPLPALKDWDFAGTSVIAAMQHEVVVMPRQGNGTPVSLPGGPGDNPVRIAADGALLAVSYPHLDRKHSDGRTSSRDGIVLVYEQTGESWQQRATLSNPMSRTDHEFGGTVAIRADGLIAVGSYAPSCCQDGVGHIQLYERDKSTWRHVRTLGGEPGIGATWVGLGPSGLLASALHVPESDRWDWNVMPGLEEPNTRWWPDPVRGDASVLVVEVNEDSSTIRPAPMGSPIHVGTLLVPRQGGTAVRLPTP